MDLTQEILMCLMGEKIIALLMVQILIRETMEVRCLEEKFMEIIPLLLNRLLWKFLQIQRIWMIFQ